MEGLSGKKLIKLNAEEETSRFAFAVRSQVAQAVLKLAMWLRMDLNF